MAFSVKVMMMMATMIMIRRRGTVFNLIIMTLPTLDCTRRKPYDQVGVVQQAALSGPLGAKALFFEVNHHLPLPPIHVTPFTHEPYDTVLGGSHTKGSK